MGIIFSWQPEKGFGGCICYSGRGEERTGKRWLWIVVAAVTVTALSGVFWDSIGIYIAPKWVLRNAAMTVFEQLETRFSNHPVRLLTQPFDGSDRFLTELDFRTEAPGAHAISGDLSLQLDLSGRKMQAVGTMESNKQKTELMLYLDPSVMVIGTDKDPGSIRYGIHYDSFREDIRNIPHLSAVIEESVFTAWEQKLLYVKNAVDRDYSLPELPFVSADTVNKLLWGLVFMPCTIERIPCAEGYPMQCCRITYELSPERLRAYWSGAEGGLKVSFVLHRNKLIQLDAAAENGESLRQYSFTCTDNAAEGPLVLQLASVRGGIREEACYSVTTKAGENQFSESWVIYRDYEGSEPVGQFAYTWYPQTGDMQIITPSADPISLNLKCCETGICIASKEWSRIISGIWHRNSYLGEQRQISGTVTFRNGDSITVPDCVYLEDWSLEQLFQLLATLKSVAAVPFF